MSKKMCPTTHRLFHKIIVSTAQQLIPTCKHLKIFQNILSRSSATLELLVPFREVKQPGKQENVPSFAVIAVCSVLPCVSSWCTQKLLKILDKGHQNER